MESPPCECPVAGFCKRHNVMKNATLHKLCQNNEDYREAWDKGVMPFQENRPKKKLGSKSSNTIMLPEKPKYSIGPGTAIKAELAKWGIHPKEKKCKCNDIAAAMDELGPDALERNLDLYVAKMRESFKEWRGGIPIPTPPDFILRQIIEYGISTSRDSLINY